MEEKVEHIQRKRKKEGVSDLGQKLAEAQAKSATIPSTIHALLFSEGMNCCYLRYGDLHNTLAKRRKLVTISPADCSDGFSQCMSIVSRVGEMMSLSKEDVFNELGLDLE